MKWNSSCNLSFLPPLKDCSWMQTLKGNQCDRGCLHHQSDWIITGGEWSTHFGCLHDRWRCFPDQFCLPLWKVLAHMQLEMTEWRLNLLATYTSGWSWSCPETEILSQWGCLRRIHERNTIESWSWEWLVFGRQRWEKRHPGPVGDGKSKIVGHQWIKWSDTFLRGQNENKGEVNWAYLEVLRGMDLDNL